MTAEIVDQIADAIALRYSAANMPAPGGLPAVRYSTADLPNRLARLPCVLVTHETSDFVSGSGTRIGVLMFAVRFYLARRRDLTRETDRLGTWLPTLLGQLQASVQLGGLVARAVTDTYKVGTLRYAKLDYAGAEVMVKVTTSIPWTVTS